MKTLAVNGWSRLQAGQVAVLGVLMALELALSFMSVGTSFLKVSFTFITIGLIAKWFGPYWGMLVTFILDFVTNFMHGMPYIFPFALVAVLNALIFGISYYKREQLSVARIAITILIQLMLSNAILNTYLLAVYHYLPVQLTSLSDALSSPVVWARVGKQFIMWPIEVIVSILILNNRQINALYERVTK